MKKVMLIYNPHSGDRAFKTNLDAFITALQGFGFVVHLFRLDGLINLDEYLSKLDDNQYDAIAASGGDGTINSIINSMITNKINIPLTIIPSGTANDFAKFLNMPNDAKALADLINIKNVIWADIGQVNEKFFINVCGAGLFTNVSQRVNVGMKSTLGKLAYYLKSLEEIPNFQPISVRITNSKEVMEMEIFLFLALNSQGTGGFEKLVPNACVSDGLLDFLVVKSCSIVDLGKLFIKILRQDFLNEPNILYFQDNFVKIEMLEENLKYNTCDIDGEYGPKLPLTIKNIHKKIPLIIPPQ